MTYQPIAVRRSRGLHYYQAWSPKLRRRIALYSRSSLAVWLLLEASPDIDTFCERPGFILIDRQRRLADFFVRQANQGQFFVLESVSSLMPFDDLGGLLDPLAIRTITQAWLESQQQLTRNWGRILPVVTSCARLLTGEVLDPILHGLNAPQRLVDIERRFLPQDPMLTRAAVFELLRSGHLATETLQSAPLSGATSFVRIAHATPP